MRRSRHHPMRPLAAVAGLAVLAAVLMPGCASTPIRSGDAAPDWTLADTDGAVHSMSEYRGRIVLMDFWASWCPPCRRSGPHIKTLADRYGDRGLVVLGFQHEDEADPRPYLREHGYDFTFFPDADEVATAYGAGLPSFIIVDERGTVVLHQGGWNDGTEAVLAEAIERRLAADAAP